MQRNEGRVSIDLLRREQIGESKSLLVAFVELVLGVRV